MILIPQMNWRRSYNVAFSALVYIRPRLSIVRVAQRDYQRFFKEINPNPTFCWFSPWSLMLIKRNMRGGRSGPLLTLTSYCKSKQWFFLMRVFFNFFLLLHLRVFNPWAEKFKKCGQRVKSYSETVQSSVMQWSDCSTVLKLHAVCNLFWN